MVDILQDTLLIDAIELAIWWIAVPGAAAWLPGEHVHHGLVCMWCTCHVKALYLVQVLIYGACDKPGPVREDIATIIQVQTLFAHNSQLL